MTDFNDDKFRDIRMVREIGTTDGWLGRQIDKRNRYTELNHVTKCKIHERHKDTE